MKSGLNKIFWGVIILTFHINIGSIPILPDFIGYIFIGVGLDAVINLKYIDNSFKKARKVTSIMVVISLVQLFVHVMGGEQSTSPNIILIIINTILMTIPYILDYYIIEGLKEEAIEREDVGTSRALSLLWDALFIALVVSFILSSFSINFAYNEAFKISTVIVVIYIFIVRLVFLEYISKACNNCD